MIEGGAAENIEMRGQKMYGYPHGGYEDQGDSFWYEDQEHDKTDRFEFTAILSSLPSDDVHMAAGVSEEAEAALTTVDSTLNEGDLVEYGSHRFVSLSKDTKISAGIEVMYVHALKAVNES